MENIEALEKRLCLKNLGIHNTSLEDVVGTLKKIYKL